MALHKREVMLLCAVALVHLVAIAMALSRTVATVHADNGANTLVVMLRSGVTAQDEPDNGRTQTVPPEAKQAVPQTQNEQKELPRRPDSQVSKAQNAAEGGRNIDQRPAHAAPSPQPSAASKPDNSNQLIHGGSEPLSSSLNWRHPFKSDLPPSSKLFYSTKTISSGSESSGSGIIFWQAAGSSFSISGEFNVRNENVLYFVSEGTIDQGNAMRPSIYVEQWGKGSATNTHFRLEQNAIQFTASEMQNSNGTELDPVSAIWLLINAGRSDGSAFSTGVSFDLQIAGAHGLETWQIQVMGEEDVDSAIGKLKTWHLARTSKSADGRGLDVWLAPERDWWPVKIRHSDPSGGYAEMLIMEIVPTPNR